MSWRKNLAKMSGFRSRSRRDDELAEEMRDHLEREEEEHREAGMSPEEAHQAALRKFGNVDIAQEDARDTWHWAWIETWMQDLRYALRMLVKNRSFAVVAVLSLAVGIGVNCALFSFADALLLRPLPVTRPDEVVTIDSKSPSEPLGNISYPDYADFRDQSKSFDGLVAYTLYSFGFATRAGELPQMKIGLLVSGNLFEAMGVEPELGRSFRPEEDQVPGRDAVMVLSHDFWQTQLGGDRSIIGRTVRLNGIEFTVIGVAPERFTGMHVLLRPAFFVPMMMAQRLKTNSAQNLLVQRDHRGLDVKGRLKPDVTLAQAQAELATIAKSLERAYPATNKDRGVIVMTEMQSRLADDDTDAGLVVMLMTMAALVLLVACANLANLLLSRARARSREIGIRLAIGAGRMRLVRQLMCESLVVALAGGALSLIVAEGGVAFLRQIRVPTDLPIVISLQLDHRVLLFGLGASLLSAVLFGLAPALQASRTDLVSSLKAADSDSSGKQRLWGRKALVVAQVALSLVLMTVAAMLYHGFHTALVRGPGFRTDHLLVMSFDPSLVRYNEAQAQAFYKQLVEKARSTPGVKSVGLTRAIPLSPDQPTENIIPEGYVLPKDRTAVTVGSNIVDEGYLETLGVPMLRGRSFRESDTKDAPLVAVVNDAMARRYWPGQDAVGKRFRLDDEKKSWVEIVGIVKTWKHLWVGESPSPFLCMPLAQHPQTRMTLVAQSYGDPAELAAPLREVVRGLDANQPVFGVRTMADFYQARAVSVVMILTEVVGTMGLIGLLLSMMGLYGLTAYTVSRRTREIGIRMAVGADSSAVVLMVMRQGLALALIGIAIGLVASLGAETGINALFSNTHRDPLAYFVVAPTLLAVTMLAAWVPARRASRIDPTRALRFE